MNPNILLFTVHILCGLAVMFFMGSATKNTWDDKVSRVLGITVCILGFLIVALGTIGLILVINGG